MNKLTTVWLTTLLLAQMGALPAADTTKPVDSMSAFKTRLQGTLAKHLSQLVNDDGAVTEMKGKTSEGNRALAFYLMFEITSEQKFRKAALNLADQVLKDMRATKHGVLPIKEKDKPGGEKIVGGGPPALGAYASGVAFILHKEGGRADDLKYIATVLDRYPWNEEGWWASTIDVDTDGTRTMVIWIKVAASSPSEFLISGAKPV